MTFKDRLNVSVKNFYIILESWEKLTFDTLICGKRFLTQIGLTSHIPIHKLNQFKNWNDVKVIFDIKGK